MLFLLMVRLETIFYIILLEKFRATSLAVEVQELQRPITFFAVEIGL